MYVLTVGVCVVVYGGDQEPVRWWVLYVAKFAFLNVADTESNTRQHITATSHSFRHKNTTTLSWVAGLGVRGRAGGLLVSVCVCVCVLVSAALTCQMIKPVTCWLWV